MPKTKSPTDKPKRGPGRPATGTTRTKVSVSIPTALLKLAGDAARTKDESLSQFVSRAIQNLTLES